MKSLLHMHNGMASFKYKRLPEDGPSDSKHVEDVAKIEIFI